MAGSLVPRDAFGGGPVAQRNGGAARQHWEVAAQDGAAGDAPSARYLAALRRYKWMMAAVIVLGTALGVALTRVMRPEYEVHATIWIAAETPQGDEERRSGPIRAAELLHEASWPELLTSFAILEKVARQTRLYLIPESSRDAGVFASFATADRFRPGAYKLRVGDTGQRYELATAGGIRLETGTAGDSIGRRFGFRWAPLPAALGRKRTIEFSLVTPREAALALRRSLSVSLPEGTNLIHLTLGGSDPQGITTVLGAVIQEFVSVAGDLKRRNLIEVSKILKQQLEYAERELRDAEGALERFRTQTITLPAEAGPPAAGGAGAPDPVLGNFFSRKVEYENTRADRRALEQTLATVQQGTLDVSALRAAPGVESAPELRAALTEFSETEAAMRAARRTYTDDHKRVVELQHQLDELRTRRIPGLARALIAQLEQREADLGARLQNSAAEIRAIPTRTADVRRLERNVEARESLYRTIKSREEQARLAAASTMPDVSVLDAPVVPQLPSQDRAPFIILMAALASVAVAVGLALLRDRFDTRVRSPEQVSHDLGLEVVGVVPAIAQLVPELRAPDEAAQVLESFRSIRLNLSHTFDGAERVMLAISSPSSSDGKSLVSLNLALSFAEAGYRTALIDGDTRRGQLHVRLGVDPRPGFLDYLAGNAGLDAVLRASTHDNVTLIPRGTPQPNAPALLMSPALSAFLTTLQQQFDAVIVDTPPLGAAVDPFVLGAATGNMLLILRAGQTDRNLAGNKLRLLSRLPIRVLGTVINAMGRGDGAQYYAYAYEHDAPGRESARPDIERQVADLARRSASAPLAKS
ncbi:MAG: polysaccharide biosynthesis tyrosine autokinase [Gemmatimonadota bacterium]|nr:polysaccharide biosynthesis tyrosine autokinase [Gemmatimonadota bacterium]